MTLRTWNFTVLSLTKIARPISRFVRPSAMSWTTSRSRWVRAGASSPAVTAGLPAASARTTAALRLSKPDSPRATARMILTRSFRSTSLSTYAWAPRRSASATSCSSMNVESTTTPVSGRSSRIPLQTASPSASPSGVSLRSSSTTSGRVRSTVRSASAAPPASATTVISGSSSRIDRRPRRTIAWSSTIRTRVLTAYLASTAFGWARGLERRGHVEADPAAPPAHETHARPKLSSTIGHVREPAVIVRLAASGALKPALEPLRLTGAVVSHDQHDVALAVPDGHPRPRCLRVADDVEQGLPGDLGERVLGDTGKRTRAPSCTEGDLEVGRARELLDQLVERNRQVRRMLARGELVDDSADLSERGARQLLGGQQPLEHRGRAWLLLAAPLEHHADADQVLGHAVVELARNPVPLLPEQLAPARVLEAAARALELAAASLELGGVPFGRPRRRLGLLPVPLALLERPGVVEREPGVVRKRDQNRHVALLDLSVRR